jgi:hypothetical protein
MTRKTSRKRSSRRRTSVRRNPSFSPTELRNIERANLRLAAALGHIASGVDKNRLPKITMIAQSQAHKAATREGEMYGGPLNSTTYPRKHYALLEELMGGRLTAKELRYFDDAYDAYAQWNYETSSPELRERWADLRQRRHEKREPLHRNSTPGCAYCQSPPGRHRWWCKKLAKNSLTTTAEDFAAMQRGYDQLNTLANDAYNKAYKALDKDNYASAVKWFKGAAKYHAEAALAAAPRHKEEHRYLAMSCKREAEIYAARSRKTSRRR